MKEIWKELCKESEKNLNSWRLKVNGKIKRKTIDVDSIFYLRPSWNTDQGVLCTRENKKFTFLLQRNWEYSLYVIVYINMERERCDPKGGELYLNRVKTGETLLKARSNTDVQIVCKIWV